MKRYLTALVSITAIIGMGFVLAACSPNPAHCPTSGNGGDNTRTQLALGTYNSGATNILTPGSHVTLDGEDRVNHNIATINSGPSGTTGYTGYALRISSSSGTFACLAHELIQSGDAVGSTGGGMIVEKSDFVGRDLDIRPYGSGSVVTQAANDLTLSHVAFTGGAAFIGHNDASACLAIQSGDNATIADSIMSCPGGFAISGGHGTGTDHYLAISNTIVGGGTGWFSQSSNENVVLTTVDLFPSSDGPTANFIATYSANYDPPPGLAICNTVHIRWPSGYTIPSALLAKWTTACDNVTTGTTLVSSQDAGVSAEANSI